MPWPRQEEASSLDLEDLPYEVNTTEGTTSSQQGEQEWHNEDYSREYARYFRHSCPPTAYQFSDSLKRATQKIDTASSTPPLLGRVMVNERLTPDDWMQNTLHMRIHVAGAMGAGARAMATEDLPYRAGDVAAVMPSNPPSLVERFLSVLPRSIGNAADHVLHVRYNSSSSCATTNHPWPMTCTLRGLLTHCADLQALPEREDLFALSAYCNPNHAEGQVQRDKLISLSDTAGASLYGDYVIREKRNWADVLYDFDSLRQEPEEDFCEEDRHKSDVKGYRPLTLARLLSLLPSIAPRHFSIASSPLFLKLQSGSESEKGGFDIELCVAVVAGTTPHGRAYTGCCSTYLAMLPPTTKEVVRLWIYPGSFSKLPLCPAVNEREDSTREAHFETPIMCIGAGTGIAPLRSLILEREAQRLYSLEMTTLAPSNKRDVSVSHHDNTLVFGCRKKAKDFYYRSDWEQMVDSKQLRLIPAFSRDQQHKWYVQQALREADAGELIRRHILEQRGALYVAGGSKMARAVKDEIVEALAASLAGGAIDAKRMLNKLKRSGLFSVEAWS